MSEARQSDFDDEAESGTDEQAGSGTDDQTNEPSEITFDEYLHPARPRSLSSVPG